MKHLLIDTLELKRSTIINDQGSEKEDWESLGSFPCRCSRGSSGMFDKVNKEIYVVSREVNLYVLTDCPIQKDDQVVINSQTYRVRYTNIHENGVGNHHIYCIIQKVE